MTKIPVKLGPASYDVCIAEGLLLEIGSHMRALLPDVSRCIVITSRRVESLWGKKLQSSLRKTKLPFHSLSIADGEQDKNIQTVEKLLKQMISAGADRHSAVIALGGGVVGDVAGFAASIFMRGIPVVQVPTTLLAQVDAAVGGKTGVNLVAGKNLVGTFHQPKAVFIDPAILSTLPERELRAGFFEVLKCAIIRDASLFHLIESGSIAIKNRESLPQAIEAAVTVKANVVSRDEREHGLRRILNFGHTIGHALEAEAHYKDLLHGEAVGWGMIAAAHIGEQCGVTSAHVAKRIKATVLQCGPLPRLRTNASRVLQLLQADKKTVHGTPHFVLATAIGKTAVSNEVPTAIIRSAVEHIARLSAAQ